MKPADTVNDADIIFCPLPVMRPRAFYGWRALVISTAFLVPVVVLAVAAPKARGFPTILLVAVLLAGLLGFWISRSGRRARRPRAAGEGEAPAYQEAAALGGIVFDLERSRPVISLLDDGAWSWEVFEERRREARLRRPRALVDSCMERVMGDLERPGHLLEPEPILSSPAMSTWAEFLLVASYGVLAAQNFVSGRVWPAAMILLCAAIILSQVPPVRDRIPALRRDEQAPVAGVGYVEKHRRGRWTADDAMLLVSAPKASGPLYVRLVGPAGWLSLTFMSPSDPEFVRLWQRWMHPRPRPELAC